MPSPRNFRQRWRKRRSIRNQEHLSIQVFEKHLDGGPVSPLPDQRKRQRAFSSPYPVKRSKGESETFTDVHSQLENKEDDSLAAPSEPDKVKRTSDTILPVLSKPITDDNTNTADMTEQPSITAMPGLQEELKTLQESQESLITRHHALSLLALSAMSPEELQTRSMIYQLQEKNNTLQKEVDHFTRLTELLSSECENMEIVNNLLHQECQALQPLLTAVKGMNNNIFELKRLDDTMEDTIRAILQLKISEIELVT